jgi:hypothetical protein
MFNPLSNTLILQEGVGTGPGGTTVTWEDPLSILEITDVTWDVVSSDPEASPLKELSMDLEWDGPSFTFTETFATWFSRRTTYVKEEGVVGLNMTYSFDNQVARPTLLPETFLATHRVENPPRFLTLTFTVIGELTTITPEVPEDPEVPGSGSPGSSTTSDFNEQWSCTIQHNYDANIVAVRYAVENSDSYKRNLEN